jgi:hypothetical protein
LPPLKRAEYKYTTHILFFETLAIASLLRQAGAFCYPERRNNKREIKKGG